MLEMGPELVYKIYHQRKQRKKFSCFEQQQNKMHFRNLAPFSQLRKLALPAINLPSKISCRVSLRHHKKQIMFPNGILAIPVRPISLAYRLWNKKLFFIHESFVSYCNSNSKIRILFAIMCGYLGGHFIIQLFSYCRKKPPERV